MKTLAGSWEGSVMGMSTQVTIRVTSAGNAIMHDATSSEMRRQQGNSAGNAITMFYVDGDRLLLTHYSDAGNRPRMEGKISPDGKSVQFSLIDVAGGTQRGFMKCIVFTMIDANHHTGELTYIQPDGKPLQAHGEFQRTK